MSRCAKSLSKSSDSTAIVAAGGQPELYNLAADIGESVDLAAAQPGKVKELQAMWDKWSAEQAPASAPESRAGDRKKRKWNTVN